MVIWVHLLSHSTKAEDKGLSSKVTLIISAYIKETALLTGLSKPYSCRMPGKEKGRQPLNVFGL